MKFKVNYREGTCFVVPLRQGGYGLGVVARARRSRVLAYFFGPRRETIPNLEEVSMLKADAAVAVWRVGDLGLVNGQWPIIGNMEPWKHADWPVPVFVRRESLPPYRNWLVYYSDTDVAKRVKEVIELRERPELRRDVLYGYGAAEIELSKKLGD